MKSMTSKGVPRVKRTRLHKAKPLEVTHKRQDPRKNKRVTIDPDLVTWSF